MNDVSVPFFMFSEKGINEMAENEIRKCTNCCYNFIWVSQCVCLGACLGTGFHGGGGRTDWAPYTLRVGAFTLRCYEDK